MIAMKSVVFLLLIPAFLIACDGNVPTTHTVGGTLVGLAVGKSVELHNNGGDALTLSNNGGYSFATALGAGTSYTVTVFTQPSGQTCIVNDGKGTISSSNVNNVVVTCTNQSTGVKHWGTAAPISLRPQKEFLPRVAVNSNGNGMAVWESVRVTDISHDIAFSYYTKSGWSTPNVIPLLAPTSVNSFYENSRNPEVAIDPNGNAIAVWRQGDAQFEFNIWSSRYAPGSGWSQRERISDSFLDASDPQIAFDANGNALAIWKGGAGIQYNRYTAGVGWGPTALPQVISAFGADASEPILTTNANGDAMAVWTQKEDFAGNRLDLWSSRYSVTTQTWGAPQLIETNNSGLIPIFKRVVMDSTGTATVVWSQYDGTRLHVLANRHVNGAWGVATPIEASDNAPMGSALDPRITIDGNGNSLAMWRQVFGSDSESGRGGAYMSARFTPGAGWNTPVSIGTYPADRYPSSDYQISSNAAGNAVAVWTLFEQIDPEISFGPQTLFSNRFNVGSGWGSPEIIGQAVDETIDGNQADMSISSAIDANGNAVVIWSGQSPTQENDIFFNRLE
jgi:hypothetical protein